MREPDGVSGLERLVARLQVAVERLSAEEQAALDAAPAGATHGDMVRIPVWLTVEIPGELLEE